eukprot:6469364-Pyramimonas_sp.AAC.1
MGAPRKSLAPPSTNPNPTLFDGEGKEVLWDSIDLRGLDVCVDGSAFRHQIRELSRAAYSWVFLEPENDKRVATAQGTVLYTLPQTSQAAEQQAMALLP